jgi:hypothetical protein
MPKKQKPEPSNFKQALTITLAADGWVLPQSKALDVLDEHIKRLEREIETLTGGRSAGPKRIDPIEKAFPS